LDDIAANECDIHLILVDGNESLTDEKASNQLAGDVNTSKEMLMDLLDERA
jgi:hypothetical protein